MGKLRKVVIPAAGLGSRMYPLTRAQPKEMIPVLDKPVIQYVVEEALSTGADEILIIVGKGKEAIINWFDSHQLDEKFGEVPNFPEIFFVRQKDQLGLADAIKYAKKFVNDEPFMVLAGDTIYKSGTEKTVSQQLLELYKQKKSTSLSLEEVTMDKVKYYGIIDGIKEAQDVYLIKEMIEKPSIEDAPSNMAITAAYILEPDIFNYIDKIKPGKNNEYQLTDALNLMCKDKDVWGKKINGKRFDIGSKEFWIKTFIEFAREDPRFKDLF